MTTLGTRIEMPRRMAKRLAGSLFVLVILLAGCNQDPYRIPIVDDSGPSDGNRPWPDGGFNQDVRFPDLFGAPDLAPLPDISQQQCRVRPEVCNNVDDNCNDRVDEGLDKQNDPRYCEDCKGCMDLAAKNAVPGCVDGLCVITGCTGGYTDLNGRVDDGCEYRCTATGAEVCDGADNNCNGHVDEDLPLTIDICEKRGPCGDARATCQGTLGWVCQYGDQVELRTCQGDEDCGGHVRCVDNVCPGLVALAERSCDGVDNDCDGLADGPWRQSGSPTALGQPCAPTRSCTRPSDCGGGGSTCVGQVCTPKLGVCADHYEYVCDPETKQQTICRLITAGTSPGSETCNGLDDNCDGTVDDAPIDEDLIRVAGSGVPTPFDIFRYEASRPDATTTTAGQQSTGRPCSVPERLPWANVTKEQAQAACELAGARLCTVAEWVRACQGLSPTKFPYGPTFEPTTCNGRAFDTDDDAGGNQDEALPTDEPVDCMSTWSGDQELQNMSGNVKEWVATSFTGSNPVGYEIKGGAYDTPSIEDFGEGLSCAYQLPSPAADLQLSSLGFRCCRDAN